MNGKTLRYRLEALGARTLLGGLSRLDTAAASALGGRVGRLIGPCTHRDALARGNIARALPGYDTDAVVTDMWDNLGRTLFEIPKLRQIQERSAELIEFRGVELLEAALAQGRGIVVMAGHFANWELLSLLAVYTGRKVVAIYREPNNPFVQDMLRELRLPTLTLVPKSMNGIKACLEALRAGDCVALLGDQRYNRGIAVPFLGRELMVATTPALLARRFRSPVIAVRIERLGGVRFRITAEPPLAIDYGLPPEAFDRQVMTDAMAALGRWVRERPGQWFWVQKLWPGERPEGERVGL